MWPLVSSEQKAEQLGKMDWHQPTGRKMIYTNGRFVFESNCPIPIVPRQSLSRRGGPLKIMAMIDSLDCLPGCPCFLCHLIKEARGDAGLTFTKAEVTQCIFEHHEKSHRGCGKVSQLIMNGTSYKKNTITQHWTPPPPPRE